MAQILVGTCGYSYNEWIGPVYPEGTKAGDKLRLYSTLFPTVELDFAYYGMPKAENLAKMLVDGGPDLTFSIKAHKTLTHEINPSQWEGEAKTYREGIEPLLHAGRLEAVLFQFPPKTFPYTPDNSRYLGKLLDYFKDVPKAVEFRGPDWYTAKMFDGMKKRGIPLVSLDVPELDGNPPMMDVPTARTAYIRLHGRNKEAWWGSDATAKFDYLYKDSELRSWGERLERIAVQVDRILVYFNNHARGQSVQNAQTLAKMLEK
jgi:uncharacterized protein YecE (DUF72 family)